MATSNWSIKAVSAIAGWKVKGHDIDQMQKLSRRSVLTSLPGLLRVQGTRLPFLKCLWVNVCSSLNRFVHPGRLSRSVFYPRLTIVKREKLRIWKDIWHRGGICWKCQHEQRRRLRRSEGGGQRFLNVKTSRSHIWKQHCEEGRALNSPVHICKELLSIKHWLTSDVLVGGVNLGTWLNMYHNNNW